MYLLYTKDLFLLHFKIMIYFQQEN